MNTYTFHLSFYLPAELTYTSRTATESWSWTGESVRSYFLRSSRFRLSRQLRPNAPAGRGPVEKVNLVKTARAYRT